MKNKAKPAELIAAPKSLGELIKEAESHWSCEKPSGCYQFTLGKFPNGWTFNVVDNWNHWMSAGRETHFGPYPTPEQAVQEFLKYVKDNRIMVAGLQD